MTTVCKYQSHQSLDEADDDATMQESDVEKDTELDFEPFTSDASSDNTARIKWSGQDLTVQ